MAIQERSGRGFITGGVSDELPDWLGSYNEGVQAGQQQAETRQRMGQNAAREARDAARFGWDAQDRAREEAAWSATDGALAPMAKPTGPSLGVMDPLQLPAAQAPSPGLMEEITPAAAGANGAITADQKMALLPEWARMEQAEGLPPNYLETISMLESSGGTNTGSGQTFTGIFQIGPEVAADFGVTPEQLRDPRVNAQVAAKLAGRNAKALRRSLGREPQPWEIYLAHQQGLGGATALLSNPAGSAVEVLTIAYRGDRSRAEQAVIQNGGNLQMTAGEFAQKWAQKFGGALPQPFTGTPGLNTTATPEEITRLTQVSDPQATPVVNAMTDVGDERRRIAYSDIIYKLRPRNVLIDKLGALTMSTEDYNAQEAARAANVEALQWFQKPETKAMLDANPALLIEAQKDPLAFYRSRTGNAAGAAQQTAEGKGDLPVGVQTDGTLAATSPAAAPATGAAPAPSAGVGVQEPTDYVAPDATNDQVMPRVSREEAGLTQPGQGSIATQIMRTPAGQQTALPDMGAYLVEPAKIQADKFELQQARQLLEQQYAEAVRFRDRASMVEIRSKAAEIDAAYRLMDNMEAIAAMQNGDDNTMAQQLSRLSNGALRIQPVQPNGTYNVFFNGKMVYENVTKNAFLAALRSEFDAQYQAQVKAATERASAREDKMLDSELKIRENIATREADMYKQINIDAAKQALIDANPDHFIDVAEDGTVTAVPKTGPTAGRPQMFKLAPVTDPSGQPVMVNGQPKLKLVSVDGTSTVPVQ